MNKTPKANTTQLPTQRFATAAKDIEELAQLYRAATSSGEALLADAAEGAARLIADSESASVKAMYWRDIGAVADEPVGAGAIAIDPASKKMPVPVPEAGAFVQIWDRGASVPVPAPPEAAAAHYFVEAEATAAQAKYLRDFVRAATKK